MMRSMFSAVSGLAVHQTRMDVIANNISNVNTVGFKSSRALFADVFSQTVQGATGANIEQTGRGGVNAMQIGMGAQVASIDRIMTQGAAQRTDHAFDLMVEGDGFFIVGDATGTYFTRNGAVRPDAFGNLTISNGMRLMGWQVNGPHSDPPVDPGEWGEVVRAQVGGLSLTPRMQTIGAIPTSSIEWGGNIVPEGRWSAEIPAGAVTTVAPPAAATAENPNPPWTVSWPADAAAGIEAGSANWISPPVETSLNLYDAIGNRHTFRVIKELIPAGADDVTIWNVSIPELQVDNNEFALAFGPNGQLMGVLNEHVAGLITLAGGPPPTLPAAWSTAPIQPVQLVNAALPSPTVPAAAFASPITMNFNGLTQFGSTRQNPVATDMNGRSTGDLTDLSIGQDGTVMGLYSNGTIVPLFQIPLAEFVNPAGLESVGGSLFRATINSGAFNGQGEDGIMRGGVLEMSNVDISSEFTDMIITQRGFQSNSRTISTSSEMLQELVNLGR